MPDLVRLFIRHYIGGMVGLDVLGLRRLILGDPIGWVAIGAFAMVMGLTFASIECAIAVMTLGGRRNDDRSSQERAESRRPRPR